MAQHGVDGAFLQRFAGQCDLEDEGIRNQRDEVRDRQFIIKYSNLTDCCAIQIGDRVKEAAEKEGRVFAIMLESNYLSIYFTVDPCNKVRRVRCSSRSDSAHSGTRLDPPRLRQGCAKQS